MSTSLTLMVLLFSPELYKSRKRSLQCVTIISKTWRKWSVLLLTQTGTTKLMRKWKVVFYKSSNHYRISPNSFNCNVGLHWYSSLKLISEHVCSCRLVGSVGRFKVFYWCFNSHVYDRTVTFTFCVYFWITSSWNHVQ